MDMGRKRQSGASDLQLGNKPYKLRKYIRKFALPKLRHGELCGWTQGRRQRTGLAEFFTQYPWWAQVITCLYQKFDDDVRFSLHDCEKAIQGMKVEDYHYEALKIHNLMSAVRQSRPVWNQEDSKDEQPNADQDHGEPGEFSKVLFQQFTDGATFLTSDESEISETGDEAITEVPEKAALAAIADGEPRAVHDLIDSTLAQIVNHDRIDAVRNRLIQCWTTLETPGQPSCLDHRDELYDTSSGWAIRIKDGETATEVKEGPDGQAIFVFADSTHYMSSTTLYDDAALPASLIKVDGEAKASDDNNTTSIEEARKLCKNKNDYVVNVESRPKLPGGGWRVTIKDKTTGAQIYSLSSNNNKYLVSLEKAVHDANEYMEKKIKDLQVAGAHCVKKRYTGKTQPTPETATAEQTTTAEPTTIPPKKKKKKKLPPEPTTIPPKKKKKLPPTPTTGPKKKKRRFKKKLQ